MFEVGTLQKKVNHLFLELDQWQHGWRSAKTEPTIDQLALTSLKIIDALLDSNFGEVIGRELLLICSGTKASSIESELLDSLRLIEDDLEENLRGFSAMMEWILEEGQVRKDTAFVLKRVPYYRQHIIDCFSQLSKTLVIYSDLDEAFSLNSTKVPVLLFLSSLSVIYADLLGITTPQAQDAITNWLKARTKRDDMVGLINETFCLPSLLSTNNVAIGVSKDVLIVMICCRAANEETIRLAEAKLLDRMLCSVGMLGLKPLLDAGLLVLENAEQKLHVLNDSKGKILRVK